MCLYLEDFFVDYVSCVDSVASLLQFSLCCRLENFNRHIGFRRYS